MNREANPPQSPPDSFPAPTAEAIYQLLSRVATKLEIPFERSSVVTEGDTDANDDPLHGLRLSARRAGIFVQEMHLDSIEDLAGLIQEGCIIFAAHHAGDFTLVEGMSGRGFDSFRIDIHVVPAVLSPGKLRRALWGDPKSRLFVAKRELDCDMISAAPVHEELNHHHEHPSPLRRYLGLLNLDRRDIWLVVLFAFIAGTLTLATPLAVESLVNIVSWGTYVQPLLILGLILFSCLAMAGIFGILQVLLVEMIQRRQFVRIVSDLSHRFPRANQSALVSEYPRELANRVFDIMTIQKATAVLLADGVTIALTTAIGMMLLAFYHPFLLGFDIVLLIAMISITWLLGRGGVRTAIDESIAKYKVAHWLQDVIAMPTVFKTGGGESLAISRGNQLASDYILARSNQFRVLIRQIIFAISLQVVASTAVLALGGWLVIQGQLTLGQLVASELVVTVVVGAFAKAGKALEKYYDVMAGIDKVGHLIDVPVDPRRELDTPSTEPVQVHWTDLTFDRIGSKSHVGAMTIEPGKSVALVGDDPDGRGDLARSLAGLLKPSQGIVRIGDVDSVRAADNRDHQLVGYAGKADVFHGTVRENVDLGRLNLSARAVRDALSLVGLSDVISRLPNGLESRLQTGGYPLSRSEVARLAIARNIVVRPRLLVVDGLLDNLSEDQRRTLWSALDQPDKSWTLIVATNRDDVAALCETQISIRTS